MMVLLAFPLGCCRCCSGFPGSPLREPGGLGTPVAVLGLGWAVCPGFIQRAGAMVGINKCWHHCHDLSGKAE